MEQIRFSNPRTRFLVRCLEKPVGILAHDSPSELSKIMPSLWRKRKGEAADASQWRMSHVSSAKQQERASMGVGWLIVMMA